MSVHQKCMLTMANLFSMQWLKKKKKGKNPFIIFFYAQFADCLFFLLKPGNPSYISYISCLYDMEQ